MIVGGYERNPDPWCLDGDIPPTFNNTLLDPDWDRFLPLTEAGQQVVPALVDADVHPAHQRARSVHARRRVHPRRERGRRVLRRRRLLRPRHRRRRRRRQGDGRVDRRAASRRWTCGRWTSAASDRSTVSRGYCLARTDEIYSTYYDIVYPNHERHAGRPLKTPPAYARHHRARRRVRREERLGARQLVPQQRGPGARAPPAAWLGGRALVDGDRHRASRDPIGRRAVRRVELRQDRGRPAPGAAAFLERVLHQPRRPRGRARSPTRRCSTAVVASSATSPSPGLRSSAS